MSVKKGTQAERLAAVLRDLDGLTVEARQIMERADKLNRRLYDAQVKIAHIFDEEGRERND